jgi:hypothetical protein
LKTFKNRSPNRGFHLRKIAKANARTEIALASVKAGVDADVGKDSVSETDDSSEVGILPS